MFAVLRQTDFELNYSSLRDMSDSITEILEVGLQLPQWPVNTALVCMKVRIHRCGKTVALANRLTQLWVNLRVLAEEC